MVETLASPSQTLMIPLDQIDLMPDARAHDPEKLAALAEDMRRNGQLQEIIVTSVSGETAERGGRYLVLAGSGRTLAARKLGWEQIRCGVRPELSAFERLHITFSENEEREDISPLYQAALLKKMQQAGDLTQKQLAEKLGKSQQIVQQYLSLADLPAPIRENTNRFVFLGLRHFLQILRVDSDSEQVKLAELAAKGEWSVRELQRRVERQIVSRAPAEVKRVFVKPGKADPLAAIWKKLKQETEEEGYVRWQVSYPEEETWRFQVKPNGGDYADFLASWFEDLAAGLRTSESGQKNENNASTETGAPGAPGTKLESSAADLLGFPKMREISLDEPRLPVTAAEEAELRDAARQSPEAAYAWLYGKDHPYTRGTEGQSWKDVNDISDSDEALDNLLKGLKLIAGKGA